MTDQRTCLALALAVCTAAACTGGEPSTSASEALRMVLMPTDGDSDVDARIARRQGQVRAAADPTPYLESLGYLYVVKARTTFDPGWDRLAEQCAACIEETRPQAPGALLLRGHVRHSLHDFAAAEKLARTLVARRGDFLDHGLLGDVLLDTGDVDAALGCYQRMLDIKPCLQSYTRAARVKWLRGDLGAARQLLELAVGAGSRRDPEPLCWTYTQLALLDLQDGDVAAARQRATVAIEMLADYAPALLALGRIELAAARPAVAVERLRAAAAHNPLPEFQWALADALRATGAAAEAAAVEAEIRGRGPREDSRTTALWLAGRGCGDQALALARAELEQRADVFTHDAHAWALLASGRGDEARSAIERALAQGTCDARLYYHAGVIAAHNQDREQARRFLRRAEDLRRMLLPSEQRDLDRRLAAL